MAKIIQHHEDSETVEAEVYFQRFFPMGIDAETAAETIQRTLHDVERALWEVYEDAPAHPQPSDVVIQVGASAYPGLHRSQRNARPSPEVAASFYNEGYDAAMRQMRDR